MFLRIERLQTRNFVGICMKMSTAQDQSAELWRSFMPTRKHIENAIGDNVYSIQEFDQLPDFNMAASDELYTNWAVKEVSAPGSIPEGMQSFTIDSGLYAVFLHKGTPAEFGITANYIFQHWLPESQYRVENRPFFQVLTPAYKPGDPTSQEEVYIPISLK